MKKLMIAAAGAVAIGFSAVAADATPWFNGGIDAQWPDNAVGGTWSNREGSSWDADQQAVAVTAPTNAPLTFTATKTNEITKINKATFKSTVTFTPFPFDEMPAVPKEAKAGAIVLKDKDSGALSYWVLANDGMESANDWTIADKVEVASGSVEVTIELAGNEATYTFGDKGSATVNYNPGNGELGAACYAGDGSVASLSATYEASAPAVIPVVVPEGEGWTAAADPTEGTAGTSVTITYTADEGKLFANGQPTITITGGLKADGTLDTTYPTEEQLTTKDAEAKIGTTLYLTLQEALNVGGDVVMLKDATAMVKVPAGKTVNLDFNGFAITTTSKQAINNYGTLTITNGNITAQESAIVLCGNSVTTISGGTYASVDNAVIAGNGNLENTNVTLTVTGGTFNGGITSAGYIACGLYVPNSGTYDIKGGTFNITNGCGICARAGTTWVAKEVAINLTNTGTVSGYVGDKQTQVPGVKVYFDWTTPPYPGYAAGDTIMSQTKFSDVLGVGDLDLTWFSPAVNGYYALGLYADIVVHNGKLGNYRSLKDAINEAQDGHTIELYKDITTDDPEPYTITNNIEVRFGPYTVEKTVANHYTFDIANGADVKFAGYAGGVKQVQTAKNLNNPAAMIRNKGKLTIDGGVYTSDFCIIKNDEDPGMGELVIMDGTFNVVPAAKGFTDKQWALMNWGKAEIEGGTWNGVIGTRSCDRNGVSKAGVTEASPEGGDYSCLLYVGYTGDTTWENMPKVQGWKLTTANVVLEKNPSVTDKLELIEDGGWITVKATPLYTVTFSTNTVDVAEAKLTGIETGTTLTAAQVPEFTGGAWDVDPVGAVITCNTNFNYTIKAVEPVAPGEYKDTAETAVEAAAKVTIINADKASYIKAPTGAETTSTYLALFEAKATENATTGGYDITVELTSAAEKLLQAAADVEVAAALDDGEIATIPGLYYTYVGGTEVTGITTAGTKTLATAETTTVPKPNLGTTDKAFYQLKIEVK